MIALDEPLKATVSEKFSALRAALDTPEEGTAIRGLLRACAALGRDTAQKSWTMHYESEDRDDLMREDEDGLAFAILTLPLSAIYTELPGQVDSALRDTFDDEHFRLEDPNGWAEVNADLPTCGEVRL